jgi:hypothetical protein
MTQEGHSMATLDPVNPGGVLPVPAGPAPPDRGPDDSSKPSQKVPV